MSCSVETLGAWGRCCLAVGVWGLCASAWATHHEAGHASAPASAVTASADVQVSDAWIRPAVKGQSGTGGYMRLTSAAGTTLIGFTTPVAGTAELHEMVMDGTVMRMRPMASLALPAGRSVELKPGGHHLMLMDLNKPLNVGDSVQVTLKLKGSDGRVTQQIVEIPVKSPSLAPAKAGAMSHHGH